MKGFSAAEHGHVVNILPPVDVNGGANSDVFSMKGYAHASIIVTIGVSSGVGAITVEECDDFTPTASTAIAFSYYKEETAAGDTLTTKQSATTAGFTPSANDNITYVIEIDASELTDGYPNLRVAFATPGAACLVSAVAVLSGSRYAGDPANVATAIA